MCTQATETVNEYLKTDDMDVQSKSDNVTNDILLEELHRKLLDEYIPVIVFVAVQMVVGITGNTLAFIYYGFKAKKNSSSVFIASLAGIDLFVCIMYSWHIADLRCNVYYGSVACKFEYFFNHWLVVSSVFVLEVITFDRYFKICRPFSKRQFNIERTKKVVLMAIIISAVASTRDFIILDIVKVNMSNSNGTLTMVHYCSHTDKPSMETFVLVAHIVDLTIACTVTITLLTLYTLILIKMVQLKRHINVQRIAFAGVHMGKASNDLVSENAPTVCADIASSIYVIETCTDLTIPHEIDTHHSSTEVHPNESRHTSSSLRVHRISIAERNITYSMMIITMTFVGSFIPYFVFVVKLRATTTTMQSELSVGPQLLFRMFMINSVVNPFVYCFFNSEFRNFLFNKCRQ